MRGSLYLCQKSRLLYHVRTARIALLLFGIATGASAAEGFGTFRNVVSMERLSPPQRVLPVKHVAIVFDDSTHRGGPLRQRIEALIRAGDPAMRIGADAPYTLTIHLTAFLEGKTRSIEGTFDLADRTGRVLSDGRVSASNAGALINEPDDHLVDEAAHDVARMVVPTRHHTAVLIPKGRLDALAPLAERGEWAAYLAALERLPELAGDAESYRQYALAVAHEGAGYGSTDAVARVSHLRAAVQRNLAASRLKPSEEGFTQSYSPMSRAFASPGLPPRLWVDPHALELWESIALIDTWMKTRPPAGILDNRAVLDLAAAGRSEAALVAAIAGAKRVQFVLGQAEMTALSKAGISWPVIDAMRARAGLPRREFRLTPDSW